MDDFKQIMADLDARTDQMVSEGRGKGIFRQCSIGYHLECSDPMGVDCKCPCHPIVAGALQAAAERGEIR